MAVKKWVVSTTTSIVTVKGQRVIVREGDMYDKANPLVKRLGHFVTPEEYAKRTGTLVESATAAPGEKRNVTIPTE